MGKGDKKSKRGKIIMGSYGVRRQRKTAVSRVSTAQAGVPEKPAEKPKIKDVEAKAKTTESKPKSPRKPKAEANAEVKDIKDVS